VDRVLGVAMTSAAVRMVLVDGATGEGATVDRDVFDTAAFQAAIGAADGDVLACAGENLPYAVGVTWTEQAAATASQFLQALAALGLQNVVTVSQIEAADALARGIADVGGYTDLATSSSGAVTAGLSLGIPWLFFDLDAAYGLGTVKYDKDTYPSEAKVQFSTNLAF